MTELTLTNFRSHTSVTVPMRGITVILGDNRSGKTNVIRGARWLCYNEGGALDSIRKHGTDFVSACGTLPDGTTVERYRDNTENRYGITDPDGASAVFGKVGGTAIDEILQLTGIAPVTVGKSEFDVHFQGVDYLSPLDIPPVDFHNILGAVSGAGTVEVAVRTASADQKRVTQDIKAAAAAVAAAETTEAALAPVLALVPLTAALDDLYRDCEAVATRYAALVALQRRYEAAEAAARIEGLDRAHALVSEIESLQERKQKVDSDANGIMMLIRKWGTAQRAVADTETELETTREDFHEAFSGLDECPLCGQPILEEVS